jgi:hypothetical protein
MASTMYHLPEEMKMGFSFKLSVTFPGEFSEKVGTLKYVSNGSTEMLTE